MIKSKSGIYYLIRDKKIVYIGKTKNIKSRLRNHAKDDSKSFDTAIAGYIKNKSNMDIIEAILIDSHKPEYNKWLKNKDFTTVKLDKNPIRYIDKVDVYKIENNNKYRNVINPYYDYENQEFVSELLIGIETVENFNKGSLIKMIEKF